MTDVIDRRLQCLESSLCGNELPLEATNRPVCSSEEFRTAVTDVLSSKLPDLKTLHSLFAKTDTALSTADQKELGRETEDGAELSSEEMLMLVLLDLLDFYSRWMQTAGVSAFQSGKLLTKVCAAYFRMQNCKREQQNGHKQQMHATLSDMSMHAFRLYKVLQPY